MRKWVVVVTGYTKNGGVPLGLTMSDSWEPTIDGIKVGTKTWAEEKAAGPHVHGGTYKAMTFDEFEELLNSLKTSKG